MTHKYGFVMFLLAGLAVAFFLRYAPLIPNDDAYITYRHALNFVQGHGMVFNPGDRLLVTTSPLHMLVLSGIGLFITDIPKAALVLGGLASYLLVIHIYLTCYRFGYPLPGLIAATLIITNPWPYLVLPLETVITSSLMMMFFYYAYGRRAILTGLLAGLAFLSRMDSVVLIGLVFGAYLIFRQKRQRVIVSALIFFGIVFAWLAFSTIYYGSPFPTTLGAKSGYAGNWLTFVNRLWPVMRGIYVGSESLTGVLVALSCIGGVAVVLQRNWLSVLFAWGGLYVFAYSALQLAFAHAWYYFPLTLLVLVFASVGIYTLASLPFLRLVAHSGGMDWEVVRQFGVGTLGLIMLVFQINFAWQYADALRTNIYTLPRLESYWQIAEWLEETTPPNATVAMHEIGIIGYYSERYVIDFLGLATPGTERQPDLADFEQYQPDYVVMVSADGNASPPALPAILVLDGVAIDSYQLLYESTVPYHRAGVYGQTP